MFATRRSRMTCAGGLLIDLHAGAITIPASDIKARLVAPRIVIISGDVTATLPE